MTKDKIITYHHSNSMKQVKSIRGIEVVFFTLIIYLLSVLPQTKLFGIHLLILSILLMGSALVFKHANKPIFTYSLIAAILFFIGLTGWFYSPFFYWIYLLAIAIAFIFNPLISTLFVAVFVVIFLPNIGSIDTTWDVFTIFSLILVIPLTAYLRGKYLELKENEKAILILEKENEKYKNIVDELLGNKVINVSAKLREKANDIKQMSYLVSKGKKYNQKRIDEIHVLSEELLGLIKKFEEHVTGQKVR